MASLGKIEVNKPPEGMTLFVTISLSRRYLVRLWLGRRLIRLAAFVLGCNIVIEETQTLNP